MSAAATLLTGEALAVLRTLPEASARCCVTSPPYFGLRDYGEPEQLGLEPTPEAYVARLVAIMREVRRVLTDDGTLFLNIGDSYFGGGRGGNPESSPHQKQRANAGSLTVAGASRLGVRLNGTPCTVPPGSTAPDCACFGLCGECATALSQGIESTGLRRPVSASPPSRTGRDSEHRGFAEAPLGVSPPGALESTTPESSGPPSAECSHCANCGACLSVLRSSSRDARLCVRRRGGTGGTDQPSGASGGHSQGTAAWDSALPNLTTPFLKQKDLIGIPWLVAFALRADGWYLRRDIIWQKPNPMPESVTDRPTSAHEYLFLLAKSATYYYDADAIAEPLLSGDTRPPHGAGQGTMPGQRAANGTRRKAGNTARKHGDAVDRPGSHLGRSIPWEDTTGTRNARSVWTIATRPYSGAHFATMPAELARRCIMAGSAPGDTVLDPFGGSGTTAATAVGCGRNAVHIELNPQYQALARERIGPMFCRGAA